MSSTDWKGTIKIFSNNLPILKSFFTIVIFWDFSSYLFSVLFHRQFVICVFFLCSCAVPVIDLKLLCQHINNEEFKEFNNNDNNNYYYYVLPSQNN
jgi:hypothetical protein